MSTALFELADFASPAPAWAEECSYCKADDRTGEYNEALHFANHLGAKCLLCGETAPNRFVFELNHAVNIGSSLGRDAVVCVSIDLRLNHLSYALSRGERPSERDLVVLDFGWTFAPDGTAFAPVGWPRAEQVKCERFAQPDLSHTSTRKKVAA